MSDLEKHWLSPGFSLHYAIRMPNGELYTPSRNAGTSPEDDYSIPAPMRDMMGMVGMFGPTPAKAPTSPKPEIFESRPQAEKKLDELRAQARQFGVTEWGGMVVARLCTPFSSGDPTVEFAEQIVHWLAESDGAR